MESIMNNMTSPKPNKKELHADKEPYEAPAIIYEDLITTRSTTGGGGKGPFSDTDVDPANIFTGDGG
jgi:hypothetical protein